MPKKSISADIDLGYEEIAEYAKADRLTLFEFKRLTGADQPGLWTIGDTGVFPEQPDAHAYSLLDGDERLVIDEMQRHRLNFPCTPKELVRFIDDSGAFDLPEGFAPLVYGERYVPPESVEARQDRFAALSRNGMSSQEIADAEGLTRQMVDKVIKKWKKRQEGFAAKATTLAGQLNGVARRK